MKPLDVSSRENYLKWVQEWRGYLKAMESEVRYWKNQKKQARDLARRFRKQYPSTAEEYGRRMNTTIDTLRRLRQIIRGLHEVRLLGKQKSFTLKQQS